MLTQIAIIIGLLCKKLQRCCLALNNKGTKNVMKIFITTCTRVIVFNVTPQHSNSIMMIKLNIMDSSNKKICYTTIA